MKLSLQFFLIFLLALVIASCSPGKEKPLSFKSPQGVKLPLEVKPVSSEAWRESQGLSVLSERNPGLLEAPAWWSGNRPPQGEMVVLELDYRDDMKLPVRAEVYSGMGSGTEFSELHRFGGAGDGTWKKSRIPCPWDLTLLYLPANSIRFRLVSDSGSMAIRGAKLVEPLAEDEERYNAETREWSRRVQENKARVDSSYYSLAQKPVLPGEWGKSPIVPFQRGWMEPVLPISAPALGETDFPLMVRMALNEYEPLQIGIYANGKNLTGVEVTVDPIQKNGKSILDEITVRVPQYSLVRSSLAGVKVEPFPQALWPVYPFDIPAGRSHMAWIVLHTVENSAVPGKYSTRIHIAAREEKEVTVPITVEILPCRLLTMEEAGLKLGGHTLGFVPEHDLAFQRKYNHNMADLWYGAIHPELKKEGGSFSMDFRLMDDWMSAAKRQGFTDVYYFLGGNPYGFPMTMDLEVDLARKVLGMGDGEWSALAMEKRDSIPGEIAGHLIEWARRVGEHAREAGWPRLVLTPFDEPAKWIQTRPETGPLAYIKPHFIHFDELLRRGYPDAPISADIHHYKGGMDFLPYLDICCTNAAHENPAMADEVRAAGKILWEFSGCNDKGMPDFARFVLGFYFASHDSRAAQIWAYNWGGRFDTLDGENWLYAWYTPFDVIPSPYMEGVREGMDERRLIETLKRKAAEKNVDISAFLDELFREVAARETALRSGEVNAENIWTRAEEAKVMDAWHNRIVEKLLSLGN